MATRRNKRPPARQRSFRLSEQTLEQLEERARETDESSNSLAQRLLDEALRTERHPLIYFRQARAGRPPAIVGTRLDVYQVIATLRANDNDVAETAAILGIPEPHVRACIAYYADFKDEVDAWADRQREIAEREEDAWRRTQEVLA
jgi:uncharacterized protein (DUF433 family)